MKIPNVSTTTVRWCIGLTAWGIVLLVALSPARMPGDGGHTICGPWGCGPPTQALVACHLGWFIALVPPVAYLCRRRPRLGRHVGLLMVVSSLVAAAATVVYQRVVWWPEVGAWHRAYFLQRCLFCVAVSVDWPVAQSLLLGAAAILCTGAGSSPFGPRRRAKAGNAS